MELGVGLACKLEILRQVPLHRVALAPCPARGADERFAVEQRHRVVIGQHAEAVLVGGIQPLGELSLVAQRLVVGVVAVEEGYPHHVIGNSRHRVDIAKDEAASAAVTA